MKILVTAGTELLPSKIARQLVSQGHHVVCFDNKPDPTRLQDCGNNVAIVKGDLNSIEELFDAIKTHKVQRIVSTTYLLGSESTARPHSAIRFNALAVNNVMEAARLAGIERVVISSSIAVYGLQSQHGERLLSEEDDSYGKPLWVYGATRKLNEFMAETYRAQFGLDIVIVRFGVMHDPWKKGAHTSWAADFATLPAQGIPMHFPYRSTQKSSVWSMNDGARLVSLLITAPKLNHGLYNAGGHARCNRELAELVKSFLPDATFSYDETAPEQPLAYLIDAKRVEQELGFRVRPLEITVREHINEVRRHFNLKEI